MPIDCIFNVSQEVQNVMLLCKNRWPHACAIGQREIFIHLFNVIDF